MSGGWVDRLPLARLAASACMAAALLAGCATPQRLAGHGTAGEFSRAGRFALTVTEPGRQPNAVQGGFAWLDDGNQYTLDLTTPLGSTEARVQGGQGQAMLTRSDGTKQAAADPDTLVQDVLGSRVPVSGMRSWLRGVLAPLPPASEVKQDPQGHLIAFEQGGWQASLSRYDKLGPSLLVLTRQGPDQRIVLRLVMNPS